ncbi:hypothetical protein LTR94_037658, partial [Friedmanniomyces endolithicus]
MAAQGRHAPADVLRCLAPYGEDLGEASFLAHQLLPARAIARAPTGHLAAAKRDLAQIRPRAAADRLKADARSEIAQ